MFDSEIVAPVLDERQPTEREALERAHRFVWQYGRHLAPCPIAADIEAPDDTPCTCGYSALADALMDDEDALGMDFWKLARAPSPGGTSGE
jgi:hypothetical protein